MEADVNIGIGVNVNVSVNAGSNLGSPEKISVDEIPPPLPTRFVSRAPEFKSQTKTIFTNSVPFRLVESLAEELGVQFFTISHQN